MGARLTIRGRGRHPTFNQYTRSVLSTVVIAKSQLDVLAKQFVDILQRNIRYGPPGGVAALKPSTLKLRQRLGLGSQPLYRTGEFHDATGQIESKHTPVFSIVRTGPLLTDIYPGSRSSGSKPLTYEQLANIIVFGLGRIITERDIMTPSLAEWENKFYSPFIAKLFKKMKA